MINSANFNTFTYIRYWWLMDVDTIQILRLHQRIKFVNYTQGDRSVAAKTGACVRTKGQHFQQAA